MRRILSRFQRREPPPVPARAHLTPRIYLLADAAVADQPDVIEAIDHALVRAARRALPEIAFTLDPAARTLDNPLATARYGADFRISATLGDVPREPADLIVVHAAMQDGQTVLKLGPAAAGMGLPGLLGPAIEGLCGLEAAPAEADAPLLAFAMSSFAIAGACTPDAAQHPWLCDFLQRLWQGVENAGRAQGAIWSLEAEMLVAWCQAWRGLAGGDEVELGQAQRRVAALLWRPPGTLSPRERAQLQTNLAVVSLALGGEPDGARRLREGLAAARAARAALPERHEPAQIGRLDGLIGDLAGALWRLEGDRLIRDEAISALRRAAGNPHLPAGARPGLDRLRRSLERTPQ